MKKIAALLCLPVMLMTARAATVTYTTAPGNITQTSTQPGGSFAGFYGTTTLGMYANNGSSGNIPQAVGFHKITADGTLGGTAQSLRVGQQISIAFNLSGSRGINGRSIGFALNNGSTFTGVANYNTGSRFEYSFTGGDNSAKIYDSGTQSANLPGFSAFSSGATYTFTLVSSNEYNFSVSGGTTYNLGNLGGTANATIDSFSLFNRGWDNNDVIFTGISVSDVALTYTANTGESRIISGGIPDNSSIANTVEKLGVGAVTFTAANTYSGITKVSAGSLLIANNTALGGTSSNTTVFAGGSLQLSNNITTAEPVILIGQTNNAFNGTDSTGALRNVSGNNTISGNVTLASMAAIASDTGTFTVGTVTNGNFRLIATGAGRTVFGNVISGTGDLLKQGTGTIALSAANTFGTGGTNSLFIDNGTVELANNAAGGPTSNGTNGWLNLGASTTGSAGNSTITLTASGLSITNPIDSRYFTANGATINTLGGSYTSGSSTLLGSIGMHNNLVINQAAGGTLIFAGSLTTNATGTAGESVTTSNLLFAAGPGVTIQGGGTVEFQNTNAYSGETYIKSGTLNFNGSSAFGGSTIRLGDDVASSTATVNIANPTGGGVVNNLINPRAGVGGTKTISSSNTSGTNTYGGTLAFDTDTTVSCVNSGGTLAFTSGLFDIKNKGLTVTGNGTVTVIASISNSVAGGTLTKTGTGTLTFYGNNAYSGATTISNGKVLVHGSSGPSAYSVASGATLGGNGKVSSASLAAGSTLSPGASVGNLTVTNLTLAANSTNVFEFDVAGGTNDTITVTGSLNNSGGLIVVNITGGTLAPGAYTLVTYGSKTGTFNPSVTVTGTAGGTVTVDESTAGVIKLVVTASTSTSVSSSQNPSARGTGVSFTATVSSSGGTPTGSVQFKTNGVAFGSPVSLSGGSATSAATTALPRGTNTITAEYPGTTGYTGSTNTLNQVVTNNPPVANADAYGRANNLQFKIKIADLLTNDTDLDSDTLTFTGVNLTSANSVTVTTNGTYIFYPSNAPNTADSLTYTISDGQGGTANGTINITVSGGLTGQTNATVSITNDVATVTFFGVPGTAYEAQRATNVNFTGTVRSWSTNAPTGGAFGVFQITDDFSDVGGPPAPSQSYYRLLVP